MEISVGITTREGDILRLSMSTIDRELFPQNISELISEIEIFEVILERETGAHPISLVSLMKVAEIIGNIMAENENAILYFYCDDIHDIPRRNRNLSPQHYRSFLFSRMHERYTYKHGISDIIDLPIILKSEHDIYIHFIIREKHLKIANGLKSYLSKLALK